MGLAALTVPDSPSYSGEWRLDEGAIAQAVARLGLKEKVHIAWTRGRTWKGGYRWREDGYGGGWHAITVTKLFVEAEDAGRAVWHELTHAQQLERSFAKGMTPAEANEEYAALEQRHGYKANPLELEAFAAMDANKRWPLATDRR